MTSDVEGKNMPLNKGGFIFTKKWATGNRPCRLSAASIHPFRVTELKLECPAGTLHPQGWYQYWLFQIITHSRRIQPDCSKL